MTIVEQLNESKSIQVAHDGAKRVQNPISNEFGSEWTSFIDFIILLISFQFAICLLSREKCSKCTIKNDSRG